MRNRVRNFMLCVALGLILVLSLLSSMQVRQAVAGPLLAPTPITAPAGGDGWVMVNYIAQTNTVDVDLNSTGQQTAGYTVVDLSNTIDATDNQTVTCYLDFSNDNSNWDRGLTVISAVSADATDMNQYNLMGRYSRITCTLGTANEVTVTVQGKASK